MMMMMIQDKYGTNNANKQVDVLAEGGFGLTVL